MKYQAPRGTRDILPGEVERWQELERRTRDVFDRYGYREVRTPLFEATEVFQRGVGEATDIVRKELYSFRDRKGRSLTLRPEGTAPLVRAYVEHSLGHGDPSARLYYVGPMFRYERPQAGRYRQFWQIGAELVGSDRAAADGEMIDLLLALLSRAGLGAGSVKLNSLGDRACRPPYRERLHAYFADRAGALCGDCRERLRTNPLRILDCRVPACETIVEGAPSVLDSLCGACRDHFGEVQGVLRALGIPYTVAPRLVRGLDYYTRTVFEVHDSGLGAQSAVGGGGRYDQLVREFGGPETPAIGFSIGMERLLLVVGESGYSPARVDACVIARSQQAAGEALAAARALRGLGSGVGDTEVLRVLVDVLGRSASAQMKWASKVGARYAVFVPRGEDGFAIRDMEAGRDGASLPSLADVRTFLLERSRAAVVTP